MAELAAKIFNVPIAIISLVDVDLMEAIKTSNIAFIEICEAKGVRLGQAISGQFRYIRNWKFFNDGLRIVSDACMKIYK